VTEPAPLPHERAFELLPWLVNGTLLGGERAAVEEHARACIVCRRELKEQQRLHAAIRDQRAADVSAEAGFERLGRDLDASQHMYARLRRIRYATATPFAVAAAAGVAVLAVLLWFTPLPQLGGSTYSTLATSPAGDGALLDIVFAEQTTAAQMQDLLDDIGGEIVAGPSNVGRYSVRMTAPGSNDEAQVRDLLGVLNADPRVRFAGRSLAEVEP
jgi:hypothetical protein